MKPKPIISLVATSMAVSLLLAAPAAVQAQLYYTANPDNTATITGYYGTVGAVSIPASINGLPVTSIGDRAFYESLSLTGVTIPTSVTTIGDYAFAYCDGLMSVTIPGSVTTIGVEAFAHCHDLISATVPGSFNIIGQGVFSYCTSLTSVTILGSFISIGQGEFAATGLTSITIPGGVINIGDFAFNDCFNLTSVTIPGSVTGIGDEAFAYCGSLTSVYFEGNAPFVGSGVFSNDNHATVYYLPGTTGWSSPFAGLPAVLVSPPVGSLEVTVNPAAAVSAGAQWQVDGGAWQTTGAVVSGLSVGSHSVAFSTVIGWTTPASQTVSISANSTATATGTYIAIPQVGSLEVTIGPAAAVSAGAQWQVDGGAWQAAGATVTNLPAGDHTVSFKAVARWHTPADQTVATGSGATTTASGVYIAVDTTKPTVKITSPKSGQTIGTQLATVAGTASDNVAVAAVFYQVDNGLWAAATGRSNWTASITLTLGANTVRAYAVDTSGNLSATNTVKVVYLLSGPLEVQIVGHGTVTPNYDGQLLQIGKEFTLTAKAAIGFRFLGWSGSLENKSTVLPFVMASNLTFTATFVDSTRPVNVVIYPAVNARVTNDVITARGKATDNVGVTMVWYQFNSNGWTQASTTDAWTNWMTAPLTLLPRANVIHAVAEDAAQNFSLTNTVKFLHP
jgi:hypothetical protein